jgi:hypothetical protein
VPPAGQRADILEHAPGDHVPAVPDRPPPVPDQPPLPLPSDHPLFHRYQPIEPGPEFTRADGSLIYPDESLPIKPYAISGTVIPDANLPVENPRALPPGYQIEQSQVAPWFHQPGGGTQYRIIGPDGKDAPVDALLDSGYLREVRN